MGGHHKPEIPEVPDWRIYRVEDVPQLVEVQKKLCRLGLHDPWLRNEVWKYTEEMNKYSRSKRITNICFTGFKYGLIAALITSGIEYALFPLRKAPTYDDEGGHH